MSVVDLLSTQITAKEAAENINPELASNVLLETVARVTPAADDTVASTYRFMRVPSNARVSSLEMTTPAGATAGAINVGIAYSNDHIDPDIAGTVVDADFFASAVSLIGAAQANVDITQESAVYTDANREKALWEALGLSEDPHVEFDIYATITTTFNAGPTSLLLRGRWTR